MKAKALCTESMQQARARQIQLTKPPGSLGKLESIAIQLAGCQGRGCPQINRPWITVFAADHGVTEEGVSAFPAAVTQEMVKNFSAGGAAITVLARANEARFEVVDVGVIEDLSPMPDLVSDRVASGSRNFLHQPAMTTEMLQRALESGQRAVHRAKQAGCDLFVAGEMGIGNTTSAAAMISRLCHCSVGDVVGYGTGIGDQQKRHKIAVIEAALHTHDAQMQDALSVLRCVGGLEVAAMTGAYLACAREGLPVVVDGVIASAAALVACEMEPQAQSWMLFGHQSVEPAQQAVFERLRAEPVLNLNMRLGEGSGAAMAISVIRQACLLHAQMATFEQAGVSDAH